MTTVPNLHTWDDPRVPLALVPYLVLAGLAAAIVLALAREGRQSGSSAATTQHTLFLALATGAALLVLPFLPASGAFVTPGFTIAERVLYLPSAGFCVLAAVSICPRRRRTRTRWLSRALVLATFLVHSVATLRRNIDWRTNLSLLESGVRHQPTNSKLRYNLGYVYHASPQAQTRTRTRTQTQTTPASRAEEAMHHLRAARRLLPTMHEAACVEASVLREQSRLAEAEGLLRDTLRLAAATPSQEQQQEGEVVVVVGQGGGGRACGW